MIISVLTVLRSHGATLNNSYGDKFILITDTVIAGDDEESDVVCWFWRTDFMMRFMVELESL